MNQAGCSPSVAVDFKQVANIVKIAHLVAVMVMTMMMMMMMVIVILRIVMMTNTFPTQ